MRGAGVCSSPTHRTSHPLARLSPALEDTENVPPMASVNQSSGHRFWVAPCWSFGPLLTSGKGLTKSKPGTLTCANHRMTQGGGDLPPSPEEPTFLC